MKTHAPIEHARPCAQTPNLCDCKSPEELHGADPFPWPRTVITPLECYVECPACGLRSMELALDDIAEHERHDPAFLFRIFGIAAERWNNEYHNDMHARFDETPPLSRD